MIFTDDKPFLGSVVSEGSAPFVIWRRIRKHVRGVGQNGIVMIGLFLARRSCPDPFDDLAAGLIKGARAICDIVGKIGLVIRRHLAPL